MGGAKVSTNRALGLLLTIAVLLAACTSAKTAETRRLQAQNAYERGLTQADRRSTMTASASFCWISGRSIRPSPR